MSTTQLIEAFSALTDSQQDEIVSRIKELSSVKTQKSAFPKEILDRIDARREQIRREKGELPDSTDFLRRSREGDEY